jgi:hypothetical protein
VRGTALLIWWCFVAAGGVLSLLHVCSSGSVCMDLRAAAGLTPGGGGGALLAVLALSVALRQRWAHAPG